MSEPKFSVTFELPRDTDAYEPSQHFMERLKYRTDPEPSKEIACEVIEEGEIHTTHEPDRVIFEREIGWHTWRVLVAVNRAAFYEPGAHHTLLTIYANGQHNCNHKTVFEGTSA